MNGMKKILVAAFLIISVGVFAQPAPAEFKSIKYSFGTVPQNIPVTTSFSFTNKSAKPLVIEVATADCGCTSPDYPKAPILPGKSDVIKVTYNAANSGHFEKNVTVKFANYSQPVILEIDGDVKEKPAKSN
jgi:hypothetical protein